MRYKVEPRTIGEPQISVIIPCYNAAATLQTQLRALARQDWHGWWEVLVVDNGSTDGSAALAESAGTALGLPRLRVLHATERRCAAHARNVGALHATGDVLAFADADDEAGEGWLRAVADAVCTHALVASRLEYDKLNGPRVPDMRGRPQIHGLQRYIYPPFLPHAACAGLVVRRELHQRLGGFDESMWMLEDTDYCWRAQLAGVPLAFEPTALMHYRLRASLAGGCRQARRWAQYNVKLYKRYRGQGMCRLRAGTALRAWWRLALRGGELFDRQKRGRWLWDVNWAMGRVYGSLKYRTFGF